MQGLARKLPVDDTWLVDGVGCAVGGAGMAACVGAVFASVGHATGRGRGGEGNFWASWVVVCEAERKGVESHDRTEQHRKTAPLCVDGGCVMFTTDGTRNIDSTVNPGPYGPALFGFERLSMCRSIKTKDGWDQPRQS